MNITKATRALVWGRDQRRCFRCGVYLHYGMGWHSIHHRIPRGMGGSKSEKINGAANLLLLCGSGTTGCHGEIEQDRTISLTNGWLLNRHYDPEKVDVLRWRKEWVRLTNEGGLTHIRNEVLATDW